MRALSRAIVGSNPDLIVSGDDLATQHLHALHSQSAQYGAQGAKVRDLIEHSLGSPEGYAIAYARAPFLHLAEEAGIRVPATVSIVAAHDVENWASEHGFPAVMKADGMTGGEGVRLVRSLEVAQRARRELRASPSFARAAKRALLDQDWTLVRPSLLRKRRDVSIQSFVRGHEATSAIVCREGVLLASLHFEVLQKTSPHGPATVLRLIQNSEMQSAAEKIAKRLCLSGFHGLDFMLEEETGRPYLIELNPRATQVGHLTLGARRDLPAALYAAMTGEPIRPAAKLTENQIICLFPGECLRDPESEYLRTGYHDLPFGEPELARACLRKKGISASSAERWILAASVMPSA